VQVEEFVEARRKFDELLLEAGNVCALLCDAKEYLATLQGKLTEGLMTPGQAEAIEQEIARFNERIQTLEARVLEAGKQVRGFLGGLSSAPKIP